MSLIKGCNQIIEKYNMDESDKKFILDLYEECKQNYEQNCIDSDILDHYSNIMNSIVQYTNDNDLNELKKKIKKIFNPLNKNGLDLPKNLYNSDELYYILHNKK